MLAAAGRKPVVRAGQVRPGRREERADERIQYLAIHDSLTGLPNREISTAACATRSRPRAATSGSAPCCSSISTASRSSTTRSATPRATSCWSRSPTGCAACTRRAMSSRASAATNSSCMLDESPDRDETVDASPANLAGDCAGDDAGGHECHTTASIGVAIYPDNGADAQTLTKNADMAMYAAKGDGKNDFRFFSAEVKTQSIERLALETASAPRAGTWPVLAALPAEARCGDAARSPASRRCCAGRIPELGMVPPLTVHSARRGNRPDRADRPLGAEDRLRAEHAVAARGLPAGVDGGKSVAAAIRRRAPAARTSTRRWRQAACRRGCCSSKSPKAW